MPRRLEYRELEPIERRVALMRVAGMSEAVVGRFLDTDCMTVSAILKRPHVARFIIALESTFVQDLKESAKHLDNAIMNEANRAFIVEKEVMERLFAKEDDVRAQLGAATTAQDILDRAGKRAPTKVIGEVLHSVDAEALSHVADVLQEALTHKIIDVTGNGNGNKEGDRLAGEEAPE
jgi:hypothetical protein